MQKRNAPGHKAEGVVCQLPGDTDAYSITTLRCQYLARCGVPHSRAAIVASLAFGEARL